MKKATNRILSFLIAFAMVIGVLVAPFTSANAAEAETPETPTTEVTIPGEATTSTKDEAETDKVTVHKILMSKDAMEKHDKEKNIKVVNLISRHSSKTVQKILEMFTLYGKLKMEANSSKLLLETN